MSQQQIQPNKYESVLNQVTKGNFTGVEVPKEMPKADRYHYKLLEITTVINKAERKVYYKTRVVSVNEKSFESVSKSLNAKEDTTVMILHDPAQQRKVESMAAEKKTEVVDEQAAKAAAEAAEKAAAEEAKRREEEAEINRMIEEEAKEAEAKAAAEAGTKEEK